MSDQVLRELELVVTDAAELVALLRAGDRLVLTQPDGWQLLHGKVRVAGDAVRQLLGHGVGAGPFGGRLAPLGDTLLPQLAHLSQTWVWADEVSAAAH